MKRPVTIIAVLLLTLVSTLCAQGRYHAGDVVPKPFLKVYGTEGFFKVMPISNDLKMRMKECSLKDENTVACDDLRYLQVLHKDRDGNSIVGELVCHASIADDLLEIFKALYQAGYPIEKMLLIEHYGGDDEASMLDNNTSCFNQRAITAGGRVSKHSYGLAVDINPKYNPYYRVKESGQTIIRPEGSEEYVDRNAVFPYKIMKNDPCYALFRQHGFYWGGDWASGKDYQHFEKCQLKICAPTPQSDTSNLPAGRRQLPQGQQDSIRQN